jgi:hypothetical protein
MLCGIQPGCGDAVGRLEPGMEFGVKKGASCLRGPRWKWLLPLRW